MYGGNCCNTFQLILPHGPGRISFFLSFFLFCFFHFFRPLHTGPTFLMCTCFREKQSVLGLNQQDEKLSLKWSHSALVVPWALLLSCTSSATPAGITTWEEVKVTSYWVKAPSFLISEITPPRHIKANPVELIYCVFVRPQILSGPFRRSGLLKEPLLVFTYGEEVWLSESHTHTLAPFFPTLLSSHPFWVQLYR